MARQTRHAIDRYGFPLAAALLLALGSLVVWSMLNLRASQRWVEHTFEVRATLQHVEMLQERAAARTRGYILFQRAEDLSAYRGADHAIRLELDHLITLVADNPPQQERARQLRRTVLERLSFLDLATSEVSRDGRLAGGSSLISKADELHKIAISRMATMLDVEEALLQNRKIGADRAILILVMGALFAVPFSLLVLYVVNRQLRRENHVRQAAQMELEGSVGSLKSLSGELEKLGDFSSMLQGVGTTAEAVELSERFFASLWPDLGGSLFLIKSSRDHSEAMGTWGVHQVPTDVAPAPNDCWAVRRNQLHYSSDVLGVACPHAHPPAGEDYVAVCAPLVGRGEVFGWVYLSGPEGAALPNANTLLAATEQLSSTLANLQLREALRLEAIRDPLTRLYNRRSLEESLAREIARCVRRNLPLTLLLLDLDHFKLFNDTHGHAAGDLVLEAFGSLLLGMCRNEDIACRLGGEEFVLVLPEVSEEVAAHRAEAIRVSTSRLHLKLGEAELRTLNVSIGVAEMPPGGSTTAELLHAADEALYRAKRAGRNRVEIARHA